jgi:hypothetical protein
MIRRQVQRQRFSTKRKVEAVLRLLRGEELDALSRELGVTAARLSKWRGVYRWPPFGVEEVEAMSRATSASTSRC